MSSEGSTSLFHNLSSKFRRELFPTLPFHQLAKHLTLFTIFYLLLLYESIFFAARCNTYLIYLPKKLNQSILILRNGQQFFRAHLFPADTKRLS